MLESLEREWHFTLLFSCTKSTEQRCPLRSERSTPSSEGLVKQHGFLGKTEAIAASQPEDSRSQAARSHGSRGSPGFLGEQSWGAEPNPAWLDPGMQESRGDSQQGRVTSPEASCGHSLLRGYDLIRFPQRSAPCMNYSVSLFYFPRGTDDAPALSGEAVTIVSSCSRE